MNNTHEGGFNVQTHLDREEMVTVLDNHKADLPYVMTKLVCRTLEGQGTYEYDCFADELNALSAEDKQAWHDFTRFVQESI